MEDKENKRIFEDIILYYKKFGRIIEGDKSNSKSLSRKQYKYYAKKTEKIDFGCNIKPNGVYIICHGRSYPTMTACCSNCITHSGRIGYMEYIHKDDIRTLKRYWNESDGFWRYGKGCVLPRSLRSIACLTHSCSIAKMEKKDKKLLNIFFKHTSR